MDKRKRIDEILAEITNHGIKGTATLSAYGQDKVNEAKSSLLSHILAEMPKKMEIDDVYHCRYGNEANYENKAYNQAIEEVINKLKELFQ